MATLACAAFLPLKEQTPFACWRRSGWASVQIRCLLVAELLLACQAACSAVCKLLPCADGLHVLASQQQPALTLRLPPCCHPSIPNVQVSQQQRDHAKQLTYGLLYGMGAVKLADELGCSVAEARSAQERFRASLPGIEAWQARVVADCRRLGYVEVRAAMDAANIPLVDCCEMVLSWTAFADCKVCIVDAFLCSQSVGCSQLAIQTLLSCCGAAADTSRPPSLPAQHQLP